MHTVNIHEAKTHLSRLVERAAHGEPFIIAKAGNPLVRVTAIAQESQPPTQRMGFMQGRMQIPDDFGTMFADDIGRMFNAPYSLNA